MAALPGAAGVVVAQTEDEPQGIDLFLPAGYDLFWSAVILVIIAAAATPVRKRSRTRSGRSGARAQAAVPMAKMARPTRMMLRRPIRSPRGP